MDYPNLDLSNMSKEDLLEKMQKCQSMILNSQHNHSLNSSIRNIYEAYEYEYNQRMAQERFEKNEKENKTTVIEIGSIEDISKK